MYTNQIDKQVRSLNVQSWQDIYRLISQFVVNNSLCGLPVNYFKQSLKRGIFFEIAGSDIGQSGIETACKYHCFIVNDVKPTRTVRYSVA